MKPVLLALTSILALTACRTTLTERLAPPAPAVVRHASPQRAWSVVDGDKTVGEVVLFQTPNEPEAAVYVVRNPWQQDLGMIDSLGRAWRYVPHRRNAEWVSTGTVAEGAARILDAETPCRLEETALPAADR